MKTASLNSSSKKTGLGSKLLGLFLIVVVALALWFAVGFAGAQTRDQGAVSLRDSVMETAMQCFAIEGVYPPSLAYMEEHYGLTVNHDSYVVTYESFAPNVMPSVAVTVR